MLPCISEPRKELSKYAPKMYTLSINPDKIGDVIGKGGKVIQEIQADYDVKINIEEDGRVYISGIDADKCKGAVEIVVNVGDSVIVKCIEIDDQGRINLSRRDALIELEGMKPENEIDETPRKPRRDNHRRDNNRK